MDIRTDKGTEDRKIIVRSKTSRVLYCCLLLIFLKVLLVIGISLYLLRHLWKNQDETKPTVDVHPEIEIPGLIDGKSKLYYETIAEEYILNSTFAYSPDKQANDQKDSNQDWNTGQSPYPARKQHMASPQVLNTLKSMIECTDRELKSELFQHNGFWVLKNYFHAGHGEIECHTSVTYVTHGTLIDLASLPDLVKRWEGPVSVAIYAPGADFQRTLKALYYVLNCLPESHLLRLFVSVHIYFDYEYTPNMVWKHQHYEAQRFVDVNCSQPPLYQTLALDGLYMGKMGLLYPANVGRNIARDAALTHFILDAEIDMHPSKGLSGQFLEMVAISKNILQANPLRVFALPVFGISSESDLPINRVKLDLLQSKGKAGLLPDDACYQCNTFFNKLEVINRTQKEGLHVRYIVKRIGPFKNWQPYFISTVDEPHHNERVSRDSGLDRNVQAYTLCSLDYEFHLLENAFLMRHWKINSDTSSSNAKTLKWNILREQTEKYLLRVLYPNLKKIYGLTHGCNILERRLVDSSSLTFL